MRSAKIFSLAAIILLIACNKVPITGRKQVNLLPESDLIAMSLQAYKEVLSESEVVTNTADAAMVTRVGEKIANAATSLMKQQNTMERVAGFKWEYKLIQSDEVNAWCLSGGKIAVYTGLLRITQTETGLAVVMGHEVAHALARHGNERMSQGLVAQLGGVALSVAVANKPTETQNLFLAAYGIGATYGALLPYSRTHELEADRIGMSLMAIAGYDPNEAVGLWQRMKQETKGNDIPELLSTHPSDDHRIAEIRAYLPEAMKYYKPSTQ